MLPSSNELRYFIEIASTLNFNRASERLGVSQPTLTSAIKNLEHQIDAALFIRHKKGVSLTPAGILLQKSADKLLHDWALIKKRTKESMDEIAGHFTFGIHPSVALFTLPKFLGEVLAEHPKLNLSFVHNPSRFILEEIVSHKIDLGIVVNPIKHPDLIIKKLYEDQMGFWVHPSLLKKNRFKDLPLFCDLNLLQTEDLLKRLKGDFVSKRIIPTQSLEMISSLVTSKAGIGIAPERVIKIFDTKNELILLKDLPLYKDHHALVYRFEQKNVKTISYLSNVIFESLSNK